MNIKYITTSLEENDYIEFNKLWTVSLNPSNQNFHNKMIRSFAINNPVDVISIRPFSKAKCAIKVLKADTKTVGNITYHYLKIKRNKLFRLVSLRSQVKDLIEEIKTDDSVVITDTINPKCVSITNYIQRKFHLPAIGVCTDSPSNITGTSKSYTLFLLRTCRQLNGFITLTEGLNLLFNPNNKDHITIEGIVESKDVDIDISVEGKYIFFGGALLPRYGVYNLIEAFKNIDNKDISLLICGHHANEEQIANAIDGDPRIKYMGTLPVKEVLALEKKALANINPRPFTQDLDRLSIPSKTLEYLASGSLTISVRNTELEKTFKDCAIWAKSGNPKDLEASLKAAINMDEKEREKTAKIAKNTAISHYSLEKISELVTDFSSKFIK